MSHPRRAYTLAEMVVVGGILAVIVLLLIPAVSWARAAATAASCRDRLRQVGMAVHAYAIDWEGMIPAESNRGVLVLARSPAWFARLPAYVERQDIGTGRTIFQCPGFRWVGATVFDNASPKSFKMNARFERFAPRHYVLGSCRSQGELVLFADAVAGETGMGQWGHCLPTAVDDTRHRGANVLCADAHTTLVKRRPKGKAWADLLRWEAPEW